MRLADANKIFEIQLYAPIPAACNARCGEQLARRAARFGKFVVAIGRNAKRDAHFCRMPRCGWGERVF